MSPRSSNLNKVLTGTHSIYNNHDMIASPTMNTLLSLSPRELWALAWLEGQTLGEVLKTVRKDWGRRTPGYLSQLKMAAMLEKVHGEYAPSQGTISNIENDLVPIYDLHESVRLDLLKLYPLSDEQIAELDERFELRLPKPSNVENFTSDGPVFLGNVDGVTIRNVGNPDEGGYTLPLDALQGRDSDNCFFVTATGGILACPEVRAAHSPLTKIFFDRTKKPEEGSMVAYKIKGEESYVLKVWHEKPPPVPVTVQTYDETRYVVLYPNDPVLEQLGTKFSHLGFSDK
jgi:hypothetical protein